MQEEGLVVQVSPISYGQVFEMGKSMKLVPLKCRIWF